MQISRNYLKFLFYCTLLRWLLLAFFDIVQLLKNCGMISNSNHIYYFYSFLFNIHVCRSVFLHISSSKFSKHRFGHHFFFFFFSSFYLYFSCCFMGRTAKNTEKLSYFRNTFSKHLLVSVNIAVFSMVSLLQCCIIVFLFSSFESALTVHHSNTKLALIENKWKVTHSE